MIINKLTYEDGVNMMKKLCSEINDDNKKELEVFENMKIYYPGGKESGDYIFKVSGRVLRHSDICKIIVNYIKNGTLTYYEAMHVLEDVYMNGLKNVESDKYQIQYLKHILFWATLQEDINYFKAHQEGRKMAFKRYAEAVLSTFDIVSLEDVMRRADNYKLVQKTPLIFPKVPSFYY